MGHSREAAWEQQQQQYQQQQYVDGTSDSNDSDSGWETVGGEGEGGGRAASEASQSHRWSSGGTGGVGDEMGERALNAEQLASWKDIQALGVSATAMQWGWGAGGALGEGSLQAGPPFAGQQPQGQGQGARVGGGGAAYPTAPHNENPLPRRHSQSQGQGQSQGQSQGVGQGQGQGQGRSPLGGGAQPPAPSAASTLPSMANKAERMRHAMASMSAGGGVAGASGVAGWGGAYSVQGLHAGPGGPRHSGGGSNSVSAPGTDVHAWQQGGVDGPQLSATATQDDQSILPSDALFRAIKSQLSALQQSFAQQHGGHGRSATLLAHLGPDTGAHSSCPSEHCI